jgi:succinate dehydrogenase cytochrome b subunit
MYKRPVYLNLFQLHLPFMGWVSFLHRVTGVMLFLALPLSLYVLQNSLSGPTGFEKVSSVLVHPMGRAAMLIVIVSLAHHIFAGLRHLAMDMHWGVDGTAANLSARLVVVATGLVSLMAMWRLFQ